MHTQPEIALISKTRDDESFLLDLFYEARADEFLALGLPRPALEQLLSMQFRVQAMGYASQFPNAEDKVIWSADRRVGRLQFFTELVGARTCCRPTPAPLTSLQQPRTLVAFRRLLEAMRPLGVYGSCFFNFVLTSGVRLHDESLSLVGTMLSSCR